MALLVLQVRRESRTPSRLEMLISEHCRGLNMRI